MQDIKAEGLGLEIMIRYKCEECGGDGAERSPVPRCGNGQGHVIGNCDKCGGQGKLQKWISFADLMVPIATFEVDK